MTASRKSTPQQPRSRRPAPTTSEEYEDRNTLLAMDLAARQLEDGTASAQVITLYLKAASRREKLEQARLSAEVEMLAAKKAQLEAEAHDAELYEKAITAMRKYSGHDTLEDDDDPFR